MPEQPEPATFLLVDDDKLSILSVKRALKKLKIKNDTVAASNGEQALNILNNAIDAKTGRIPPFIVTLDINMPRMSGPEFVEIVRRQSSLSTVRILAFESSETLVEHCPAFENRVSAKLTKDDLQNSLALALKQVDAAEELLQ